MKESSRNIFIKFICLLLIWSSLTINDIIPNIIKFEPAIKLEKSISYVTSGQWRNNRYAREVENIKFSKNGYSNYVNTGIDANITSSDIASAYYYDKKLYVFGNDVFFSVQPTDSPGSATIYKDVTISPTISSFILKDENIVGVNNNGNSISVSCMSDQLEHTFLNSAETSLLEDMSFHNISNLIYTILIRQERGQISIQDMAVLLYCTQKGILLGWINETAWIADDRTDPESVTVYTMSSNDNITEKFQYKNTYTGMGSGRFIVDNALVYADENKMHIYYLDGTEHFYIPPEKYGYPADAMNYLYNSETDVYWIGYLNDETVYFFDYHNADFKKSTISLIQDGKHAIGLFAADGYFYSILEGEGTHIAWWNP